MVVVVPNPIATEPAVVIFPEPVVTAPTVVVIHCPIATEPSIVVVLDPIATWMKRKRILVEKSMEGNPGQLGRYW